MLRVAYFVAPLLLAAGMVAAAEMPVASSILPPGMRSITVTMTRDRSMVRKREPSRKAFLRSLSEPIGGDRSVRPK